MYEIRVYDKDGKKLQGKLSLTLCEEDSFGMNFSSPYYQNGINREVKSATVTRDAIKLRILVPLLPHDRRYDVNNEFCEEEITIRGMVSVPYDVYERAYDIKGLSVSDDFKRGHTKSLKRK